MDTWNTKRISDGDRLRVYFSNTYKQLIAQILVDTATVIVLGWILLTISPDLILALAAALLLAGIFLPLWTFREYSLGDDGITVKNRIFGNGYQIPYDQISAVTVSRIFPGSIWPSWLFGSYAIKISTSKAYTLWFSGSWICDLKQDCRDFLKQLEQKIGKEKIAIKTRTLPD